MNHAAKNDQIMNTAEPIEEEEQLEHGFLDEAMDDKLEEDSEDGEEGSTIVDDDPDDLDDPDEDEV